MSLKLLSRRVWGDTSPSVPSTEELFLLPMSHTYINSARIYRGGKNTPFYARKHPTASKCKLCMKSIWWNHEKGKWIPREYYTNRDHRYCFFETKTSVDRQTYQKT